MSDKQILLADPDTLILKSPYDAEEVRATKRIPGAKWDRVRRVWTFPMSSLPQVRDFARAHGVWMDSNLTGFKVPEHPVGDARLELKEGHIGVFFSYDPVMVAAIRQVPGAVFEKKYWKVPLTSIAEVKEFASNFEVEVLEAQKEELARIEEELTRESRTRHELSSSADDEHLEIDGFVGELMPFQRAGVKYASRAKRTFIADEMGLGKTVQAIATVVKEKAFPSLIVCPPSLTLNWKHEWEKFAPSYSIHVVKNRSEKLEPGLADVLVLGDSNLASYSKSLTNGFKSVVFDESHRFKNYDAQRTKAAVKVAKNPEVVLLLTGTPITNRPAEYAAQLEILGEIKEYGGKWAFYKRYAGAFQDRFGQWNIQGSSNLEELNTRLRSSCYVRRLKKDVMGELAPVRREELWVEGDPRVMKQYEKAEDDIVSFVAARAAQLAMEMGKAPSSAAVRARIRAEAAEHLVRLSNLRHLAAQAKTPASLEWVEDRVNAGLKVVVGAHHRDVVDRIASEWGDVKIQGGMSPELVEEHKRSFQEGDAPVIVVSIAAGGVGHTLTAAQDLLVLEYPWTPADMDQLVARLHRKGQEGSVLVTEMVAERTIDEKMVKLLEAKRQVVDAATEGGTAKGGSIAGELFASFIGRD